MTHFQGRRKTMAYTHTVSTMPSNVFPLLCPVREYDWIEGWSCKMIYSETGFAENNCIFETNFSRGLDEIWTVSRYDPENYVIQFVVVAPETYVIKLDICLQARDNNTTDVTWDVTVTGLTENGNTFVENFTEEAYVGLMKNREAALNHFCKTGKMLTKREFLAGLQSKFHSS
jgi:hypothetical protein